jgi:pantothenate kinase-related protein Tda10
MTDTSKTEYKAEIIASHLKERCQAVGAGKTARPLMVSMQGPQGAGKSPFMIDADNRQKHSGSCSSRSFSRLGIKDSCSIARW